VEFKKKLATLKNYKKIWLFFWLILGNFGGFSQKNLATEISVLNCHICLVNTGVEKMNNI
jgi:hypothetical protein